MPIFYEVFLQKVIVKILIITSDAHERILGQIEKSGFHEEARRTTN
jgi:hypothetical protein